MRYIKHINRFINYIVYQNSRCPINIIIYYDDIVIIIMGHNWIWEKWIYLRSLESFTQDEDMRVYMCTLHTLHINIINYKYICSEHTDTHTKHTH